MSPESAGAQSAPPSRPVLTLLETYRRVPVYGLAYPSPTVHDRAAHEEELRAAAAVPEPRFALVIDCHNIIHAGEYDVETEVETQQSPLVQALSGRLVAVARYHPSSLTSLVRTMLVHIYGRNRSSSGFAADLDAALRLVRRDIDRAVGN